MGSTPLRAAAVEAGAGAGCVGRPTRPRDAADGTEPRADLNASVEYREHLARVLVRRALEAL